MSKWMKIIIALMVLIAVLSILGVVLKAAIGLALLSLRIIVFLAVILFVMNLLKKIFN